MFSDRGVFVLNCVIVPFEVEELKYFCRCKTILVQRTYRVQVLTYDETIEHDSSLLTCQYYPIMNDI